MFGKSVNWTPWGQPDSIEGYVPGVFFVSTASHGGFYVSPDAMKRAPAWLAKAQTFVEKSGGPKGWFEEDCDAALVVAAFAGEKIPATWGSVDLATCQAVIKEFHLEVQLA